MTLVRSAVYKSSYLLTYLLTEADFLLDLPVGGHRATTINYDVEQIFCISNSNFFMSTTNHYTSVIFNVLTGIRPSGAYKSE